MISVPPSKAVRDGVCFRGLRVLLFVVEEDQRLMAAVVRDRLMIEILRCANMQGNEKYKNKVGDPLSVIEYDAQRSKRTNMQGNEEIPSVWPRRMLA